MQLGTVAVSRVMVEGISRMMMVFSGYIGGGVYKGVGIRVVVVQVRRYVTKQIGSCGL